METERVKTGVTELDSMLHGGFLRGDSVLITGSAGTGKTTLALQYLTNGITRFGENGIYVTFEQLPSQIYRDAESMGWDLKRLEAEDKLRVVCTSPDLILSGRDDENILEEPMKKVNPQRLVIDSLSHLAMYVEEENLRKEAYRLVMGFKTKGLSTLLLWESPQITGQSFAVTEVGISFLVDSIILLRLVEVESSMRKAVVILKMRGSDHDRQLREFEITSEGFKVEAPFSSYEGVLSGSPRKVASEHFQDMFERATKRKVSERG